MEGTLRVLREFFGWSESRLTRYRRALDSIVRRSGGRIGTPEEGISDCEDWEDNRILELALAAGALLIVSSDDDLQRLSPWRGVPILSPEVFVKRVDAIRRAAAR